MGKSKKKSEKRKSGKEAVQQIIKEITKIKRPNLHIKKESFADLQEKIFDLRNSYQPHEMPNSEVTKFNKKSISFLKVGLKIQ